MFDSTTECDARSRDALDLHGCAVGEDLCQALHDFGGVVAHGDDGVGAVLRGMLQQQLVGIFAGLLAKIRQDGDVAADDGLKSRTQISDHAARPDYNSAHDAKVLDDAIARYFVGSGDHRGVHAIHSRSPGGMVTGAILPFHATLPETHGSASVGITWRRCSIT